MKFAIVVVLLALALGIESHAITYSAHSSPLTYTAHGPYVNGVPYISAYSAPIISTYSAHAPVFTAYNAAPAIATTPVVAAAPIVAAPAPVVAAPVVQAEGTYVAQTRGSVHVAPLPGHSTSASSVNLEPAPGTL